MGHWEVVKRYTRGKLAGYTLWRSVNDNCKIVYTATRDYHGRPYIPVRNVNQCRASMRAELTDLRDFIARI